MKCYCLNCRKVTNTIKIKMVSTKLWHKIYSKCSVCHANCIIVEPTERFIYS